MEIITGFKDWLFKLPSSECSSVDVIIWWEKRRIPYNFIIGVAAFGFLLLYLFFIDRSKILHPGEDAIEPIALLMFPVLWNFAYCLGWITELCARKITSVKDRLTGPTLLRLGLTFSLFITAIPAIYWGLYFLFST
jgi:hypothetical protein